MNKGDTVAHFKVPEAVGWETTLGCNMRCRHCGSTAGDKRQYEMTPEEAQSVCKQFIDMGIPRIVLTGGETLLRKDWRQIVDTLLEGGIKVGLLTNGWTLVGQTMQDLVKYRGAPFYLSVSIDGTEAVHDDIRALPGSFRRAWDGAIKLRDAGIPIACITTVHHANIESMAELREKIYCDLQPYAWQIQTTNTFGRAAEGTNNDCLLVDEVEYARVVVFACESRRMSMGTKTKVYAGDCLGYLSSLEGLLRDRPWPGCQAGLQIIGLQSNGNVKGCLSIIDDKYIEGNLLKEPLEKIWNRAGAFAFSRQFHVSQLKGICAGCAVGSLCRGGCTAGAISTKGHPHDSPHCLRAVEMAARGDASGLGAVATTEELPTAGAMPPDPRGSSAQLVQIRAPKKGKARAAKAKAQAKSRGGSRAKTAKKVAAPKKAARARR